MTRRSRARFAGVAFIAVTVLLLVGALNSRNNLLYWSFGAAVGALLVSGAVSGLAMSGVRIEPMPIPPGDAGRTLRVRYVLRNVNRWAPAFALTVEELDVPDDPDPQAQSWSAAMPRPSAFVPHLAPGASEVVEVRVTPQSRGLYRFEGARVSSSFPFGLFRKVVEAPARRDALVRPARLTPPRGLLETSASASAASAHRNRRIGQHGEFHALRAYAPGDSQRAIAWRASARSDELLVRQAAQSSPRRLWIVLHPIADEELAERAVSLAAGLAEAASRQGYRVGMSSSDQLVHALPGRLGLTRVLDALALADPVRARSHLAALRASPSDQVVLMHAGAARPPAGWHAIDAARIEARPFTGDAPFEPEQEPAE